MKIIKFEQNNCPGCQKMEMFLDMVVNDKPDKTYNLSKEPEAVEEAAKYGIMTLPALLLLDDEGKEVERIIGFDGQQEKIIEMFGKRK